MPRTMTPAKPIPEWVRPLVSGDEYLAISNSERMNRARGELDEALRATGLPRPILEMVCWAIGFYTSEIINAVVEAPGEEEFARALAEYFPSVLADFDAGLDPLESAKRHLQEEREREQVGAAIAEAEAPKDAA